jgi:hypothetical protein
MSTEQRNDACVITVDRQVGEILRQQTLIVLEANHHCFEDVRDLGPAAQLALSRIYRDAFAVLDALGWDPDGSADAGAGAGDATDVPLTAGHMEQLCRRRRDLGHTNLDRLDVGVVDAARLAPDRLAAQALDRLRAAFWDLATRGQEP